MEQLFAPFRPICTLLVNEPSPKLLSHLSKLIQNERSDDIIQQLQEYLLFPHQVYLRNPSLPENYTIDILYSTKVILDRTWLSSDFVFNDLVTNVMKLTQTASEDGKIAIAELLSTLYSRSSFQLIDDERYKLQMSHVTLVLLTWTETEAANGVIMASLKALNSCLDTKDEGLKAMIPGILSKLVKTLRNLNLKTKAIAECIRTWRRALSEQFLTDDERTKDLKSLNHVTTHLKEIMPYSLHEKFVVRQETMKLFGNLKYEEYFLEDCVELAAIILAHEKEVGKFLENEVNDFIVRQDSSRIADFAKTQLYELTTTTKPAEYSNGDLIRLEGYLVLLKKLESYYFKTESYLKPLIKMLRRLGSVTRNYKVQNLSDDIIATDVNILFDVLVVVLKIKKEYIYLKTSEQIERFNNICGVVSDSLVTMDSYLIECLDHENESIRRETLELLCHILRRIDRNLNESVAEALADSVLKRADLADEAAECLGILSKLCPRNTVLRDYGSEFVYFILTYASDQGTIKAALEDVAAAEAELDVRSLILKYQGPLCQHLFLLLRRLSIGGKGDKKASPIFLLKVVLSFKEIRQNFRDVFQVLLTQLDLSWIDPDKSVTTEILRIVKISVQSFSDSTDVSASADRMSRLEEKMAKNNEKGAVTTLVRDLMQNDEIDRDLLREPCPTDGFHSRIESEEDDDIGIDETSETETLKNEQKYFRDCILHTRHFTSMVKCPQWQLLSIEIICHCLKSANLPQDDLLPLVHQIWQPLRLLFSSENIFVVDRAFTLLYILAKSSHDFIRHRTEKEAFPPLMNYLVRLEKLKSTNKHSLIARQASQLFDKMVDGMWEFVALLDLDEVSIDQIISLLIQVGREVDLRPKRDIDEDLIYLKRKSIVHLTSDFGNVLL